MPSVNDLNPFSSITGGSLGSIGAILLVIAIVVVIFGLVGFLIYWRVVKKQYWIKIHVFRLIGNVPTRVAIYDAKEVPFGMAGDKLWKVAPSGMFKFRVIKWLPVGKIQSAPREFWYSIREDGEWINFSLEDLNEIQKKAGVRFVQEDMRLQRLATERLLEQRLMNKSFWEKWGTTVMMIVVFLVVAVCMVIIFYQFSKLLDQFTKVEQTQLETAKILLRTFGENYITSSLNQTGGSGLVPV
jgi:hypothetical protein